MNDHDTRRDIRLRIRLNQARAGAVERYAAHRDMSAADAVLDLLDRGIEAVGADRG